MQRSPFRFVLQFAHPPSTRKPFEANKAFQFIVLVLIVALATAVGFTKSSALSAVQTTLAKNPLRLIVARFPRYEVFYDNPEHESLAGWIDTLDCGHQVEEMNFGLAQPMQAPETGRKRHRCVECGAAASVLVSKKPARSVRIDELRQPRKTA